MTFHSGSTVSVICFLILVALVFGMIIYGALKGDKSSVNRTAAFLVVWNLVSSGLVFSGIVEQKFLPFGMILFASVNLTAFYFGSSNFAKPFLNLPLWMLAAFQIFRLPLELILHDWAGSQTVPETMTWTGQNFDIVTGILALGVLIPALRTKKYIWLFNIVGIVLLLNVLRVVVLSSPVPFGWNLENPLQLIMFVPYHLIATVCVWGAIAGHVILTRKLLDRDSI